MGKNGDDISDDKNELGNPLKFKSNFKEVLNGGTFENELKAEVKNRDDDVGETLKNTNDIETFISEDGINEGNKNTKNEKDLIVDFAVCLSPLNNFYNNHAQLVEWLEANMLLGVARFTVYNHTSGYEVGKVLEHYAERGVVEVVQWEIPVEVGGLELGLRKSTDVAYYAQVTALNDCLFRSKKSSHYIINVDLDEVIVPRMVENYSELLKSLGGSSEVYSFRNVFFHLKSKQKLLKFKKSHRKLIRKHKLRTLSCQTRSSYVWNHKERSKMIVSTKVTSPLSIHLYYHIHKHTFNVPPSQALLHHYREDLWKDDKEGVTEVDVSMHRFADQLIHNVQQVNRQLDFL